MEFSGGAPAGEAERDIGTGADAIVALAVAGFPRKTHDLEGSAIMRQAADAPWPPAQE